MTVAIQASLPEELVIQCQQIVADGGAADMDALLAEALRRYLLSHGSTLTEAFVREDVEWGLRGRD